MIQKIGFLGLGTVGKYMAANLLKGRRITSYNVCYTKLLRNKIGADVRPTERIESMMSR